MTGTAAPITKLVVAVSALYAALVFVVAGLADDDDAHWGSPATGVSDSHSGTTLADSHWGAAPADSHWGATPADSHWG